MAQYWTDFSEYTTGVQPSDWTKRYNAGADWVITDDAGATGGKFLRAPSGTTDRQGFTWDDIDADANRDNVEILYRVRAPTTLTDAELYSAIRASGAAGSENLYRHGMRMRGSNTASAVEWGRYESGVFTDTAAATFIYNTTDWFWARIRVNGSDHSMSVWNANDAEPASFENTHTQGSITGVGWVGLLRYAKADLDIDVFSVGTNGDSASITNPVAVEFGPFNYDDGNPIDQAAVEMYHCADNEGADPIFLDNGLTDASGMVTLEGDIPTGRVRMTRIFKPDPSIAGKDWTNERVYTD